jgi:hypothetical protein
MFMLKHVDRNETYMHLCRKVAGSIPDSGIPKFCQS